jgi:Transposase DDE domain group 1
VLPANRYLLKRRIGRPLNEVQRSYASVTYQAGSWKKQRRVIANVKWHPGELYPRVGFVVIIMLGPAETVVAFYNKRDTPEQWIKEGKGAINWTRLSCRSFAANAVHLQLHAIAYNVGNFMRTLATPKPVKYWLLTSLKEKLIKIGAKLVSHGRYVAFQMAEVAVPRMLRNPTQSGRGYRFEFGPRSEVNTPPPKGGGFELRLEAGLIGPTGR